MLNTLTIYWADLTGAGAGFQLLQLWIVVTGSLAIWILTNPDSRYHRVGCWIGLLGQPGWFYTTAQNFQWGALVLAVITTASYIQGICPRVRSFFQRLV